MTEGNNENQVPENGRKAVPDLAKDELRAMSLYEKLAMFRDLAIQCDWTPDKKNPTYGNEYCSHRKIKGNLSPLYSRCGLDFKLNELSCDILEDRLKVSLQFIFTDIFTEKQDISVASGLAGPLITKKGEPKNQVLDVAYSNAYRNYFSNRFGFVNGLEFDEDGNFVNFNVDALDSKAIPEEPICRPAVAVPVPAKKAEQPKENPAAPVQKTEPRVVPIPIKPVGQVSVAVRTTPSGLPVRTVAVRKAEPIPEENPGQKGVAIPGLSQNENRTITRSLGLLNKAYANGTITVEDYQTVGAMVQTIRTGADADEFVLKVRNLLEGD